MTLRRQWGRAGGHLLLSIHGQAHAAKGGAMKSMKRMIVELSQEFSAPQQPNDGIYHCGHEGETPEPHSCPYAEEIGGDYRKDCTCCVRCQNQCCEDI